MDQLGISVDVESIKQYFSTDLKPRLAYPAELENVTSSAATAAGSIVGTIFNLNKEGPNRTVHPS